MSAVVGIETPSGIHFMGLKPRTTKLGDGTFSVFADVINPIPRSDWPGLIADGKGDLTAGVTWILDQGPYGDCWAFSETQTEMINRVLQGPAPVVLAPDVAVFTCGEYNGGGIDDALNQVMIPFGLPPASLCPGCDPVAGARKRYARDWAGIDWKTAAAAYKVPAGEHLDCSTFDDLTTGILSGHPATVGVNWQGGGHAICAAQVLIEDGKVYLAGPNSWGSSFSSGWGAFGPAKPGWWKLSENQLMSGFQTFGAWCLTGQVVSPSEPEPA